MVSGARWVRVEWGKGAVVSGPRWVTVEWKKGALVSTKKI